MTSPTTKPVTSIRLDPRLMKRVKRVAKTKKQTFSWVVTECIKQGLDLVAAA